MPVFPLTAINWPGATVHLNIIDPAYRRMYDDILVSGARRFLVPFTRSLPGGRVRYSEMDPQDRRLHATGSVLYLEDLEEVSEATGNAVKYVAQQKVRGRARLKKLLNPSALFRTDENGNKIDYLRAEVELIEPVDSDELGLEELAADSLIDEWCELRELAQQAEEPSLRSNETIRELIANASTWEIAELWQQLQLAVQAHRAQVRVFGEVRAWIESQRQQGLLSEDSLPQLDVVAAGMPKSLVRSLQEVRSGGGISSLQSSFWEPLLGVLAAADAASRGSTLESLARDEARLLRARLSLKGVFDS